MIYSTGSVIPEERKQDIADNNFLVNKEYLGQ
jgi:hypothetical protein